MTSTDRAATGLTDSARDLIGRQSFLVLATRNADATIHAEGVEVVGSMMADVTIAVTPPRWSSWDVESGFYTHLRGAGIPLDRPERWFR